MKLRNKKTGEIKEVEKGHFLIVYKDDYEATYVTSLAELNEEWEDYEEPKEYWFISEMCTGLQKKQDTDNGEDRFNKKIGNRFKTEEEGEKVIKKLMALTRLKDKGFRFIDWELDMKTIADGKIWFDVGTNTEWDAEHLLECEPEIKKSLDLLFGGEE